MEDFTKFIENKKNFDVIYLDFKKAFDSVPHERLLLKLKGYGIGGSILQWIESFLKGRTQRVRMGDDYSNCTNVTSGIPQGSILGPILFTIYINDLPESIKSICKIFADDTKIYNLSDQCDIIQNDLNELQKWSENGNYILIVKSVNVYTMAEVIINMNTILKMQMELKIYLVGMKKRIWGFTFLLI